MGWEFWVLWHTLKYPKYWVCMGFICYIHSVPNAAFHFKMCFKGLCMHTCYIQKSQLFVFPTGSKLFVINACNRFVPMDHFISFSTYCVNNSELNVATTLWLGGDRVLRFELVENIGHRGHVLKAMCPIVSLRSYISLHLVHWISLSNYFKHFALSLLSLT